MKLDKSLFNDNNAPVWNQWVEGSLQKMPLYLKQEQVGPHQKPLHIQPGLEINISHNGNATVVAGNNVYMQSSKQLILIPGHIPHQVFPDMSSRFKRSVICFQDEMVSQFIGEDFISFWKRKQECVLIQLGPDIYAQITYVLQQMNEEILLQRTGWKQILMSKLLEFLVLLQRNDENLNIQQESSEIPTQTASDYLELCCEYIQNHLQEDLSLKRVAELFSTSPEHFTRMFRKEKGITYYQYVLLQRVLSSKQMLAEPEMSITDIAYLLGFASSSQFGRVFKNIMKETPSDYRRSLQLTKN